MQQADQSKKIYFLLWQSSHSASSIDWSGWLRCHSVAGICTGKATRMRVGWRQGISQIGFRHLWKGSVR